VAAAVPGVPRPHHRQVRRPHRRRPRTSDGDAVTGTMAPHRLAVVGAGTMGTGIAALAVGHGVPTVLLDVDAAQLDRARDAIPRLVRLGQLMGGLPRGAAPGELVTTGCVGDLAGATAVVECVTERADL